MSEEVKGIKFYRLESEVEGDETLKGSLGASDVDGNFYYLREMLITSAYTAEYEEEVSGEVVTTAELVLTRVNGKELHVDMTPFLPNFEEYTMKADYDAVLGDLSIQLYKDDELVSVNTINGLVTDANFKSEFDNAIDFEVIKRVLSDDTIKGIGTRDQLLGINPLYINGQMRPCVSYVDVTVVDSKLPESAETGDYYLVKDFSDEYGKLYPYDAVKKIQLDLDADALKQYTSSSADVSNIGWRVPCQEDWDDMLNAVELEYAKSIGCIEYDESGNIHSTLDTYPQYTHSSDDFIGYALGYVAGRLLKSTAYWSGSTENKGWECGEDYIGTDSYGFKAEPVGYAMIDEVLLMHGKEGTEWIAGTGANFDPHSKLHQYDYVMFYGKGNAKAKTFLASGATEGGPANCVRTDLTSTDSFRSVRLVKEYDGGNYHNRENILGRGFDTVMLPSLTAENGFKVWTVENFDVDYRLEDGTYKYGSKASINDALSDASLFKHYYLAYKDANNWQYRELVNGDSVVVETPIFSGDNAFDEYRLINGELVDVTADEFKIYNRIADVEQNLEQFKEDYIKTAVWAWGAIDDITKLAKKNEANITVVSGDLNTLTDNYNDFVLGTNNAIESILNMLNEIFGSISGTASLEALKHLVSNVETISGDLYALSAQEASDVAMLNERIDIISGDVTELSGALGTVSATVEDLNSFIAEYSGDITDIKKLSGDLYSLSGQVDDKYTELNNLIESKVSNLRKELITMFNGVLAKVYNDIKGVKDDISAIKEDICNLQKAIDLINEVINKKIPAIDTRVEKLENIKAEERLENLEDRVNQCCGGEGESGETITVEYIKQLISTAVENSRLKSIYINGKQVAIDGDGIDNTDCGTFVHYIQNTDTTSFVPVTASTPVIARAPSYTGSSSNNFIPQGNIDLDDITPFNVGAIPCGTTLRELSGTNLSILLQNILFPTVYPTIYQKPEVVLTNAEPLFSADIEGEVEKDGCYIQKDYIVVEVGTNFHKRDIPLKDSYSADTDAGFYDNCKAYIKADCSKMTDDQYVTNGTSGVTYLIKKTPYNAKTEGNNIIYPNSIAPDTVWYNTSKNTEFKTVGEVEVMAEALFAETENKLIDSNGKETDNVYLTTDEGKTKLTTLEDLINEDVDGRYNFFFRHSNTLKAYVSEPIFLINGKTLSSCLNGEWSSAGNALDYMGWRKGYAQDSDGNIYPKNGVGSIIAMQKWGEMNAEFNIVTDFVSLQFGVLSPIELSNISMKAYDTNDPTNTQASNFVSKDALLEETYSFFANNQDEWLARNIPNGFVRYDKPVYIKFQCWDDCTQVSIATYYLYVWVGGAQVPTKFKIKTNNPFADNPDELENQ